MGVVMNSKGYSDILRDSDTETHGKVTHGIESKFGRSDEKAHKEQPMTTNFTAPDRVRMFLNSKHKREIAVGELVDLATEAGMQATEFREALKVLERKGDIKLEKTGMTRAQRVTAIIVNKLSETPKIVERTVETTKVVSKPEKLLPTNHIPLIAAYMKKKAIVEETTKKLTDEGIEGVSITFAQDPIGEEGIALLDLVERAQTVINKLTEERDRYKNSFDTANEALNRSRGMNKPTEAKDSGATAKTTTEASV